jgi:hypothetical protein
MDIYSEGATRQADTWGEDADQIACGSEVAHLVPSLYRGGTDATRRGARPGTRYPVLGVLSYDLT